MSSSSAEGRPGPGCSGDLDSPLARSDAHGPLTAPRGQAPRRQRRPPDRCPVAGATVHTGIWKRRSQGRRMVRRLNIDGDGQGDLEGHGGEHRAVLVYQLDSYRYWQEQLGRTTSRPGSSARTSRSTACPTTRCASATGTASATPSSRCRSRASRATGSASAWGSRAWRRCSCRTGGPASTCGCSTEGHVQAGDDIVKVASGPEAVTVAEVDGLLYLPDHPRDDLARALRVDALSPGWKASLAALLEQAERGAVDRRQPRSHRRGGAATGLGRLPPAARRRHRPRDRDRDVAAARRARRRRRCRLRCRVST